MMTSTKMSTTVKCVSCNIVINEVLAFICNKLDIMDEESISRICVTAFSDSDIVTAKRLLGESLSKSMKTRKRNGKTLRDIDDIICTLKETDPEVLPIFVARDLHKLPPVLFDHVDVTQILKDLVKMREEINTISQSYVSKEQINLLRHDIDNLKRASIVNNFSGNINPKRGACLIDSFEYNSGPMGLHPIGNERDSYGSRCSSPMSNSKNRCQHPTVEGRNNSPNTQLHIGRLPLNDIESAVSGPAEVVNNSEPASGRMTHASTIPTPPLPTAGPCYNDHKPTTQRKTYTQVLEQGEWKSQEKSESWITVQRKKLRNRFVGNKGKAVVESNNNFKAADIRIPLYIYNIAKDVTIGDIHSYIKNKTEVSVELEKMNMKTTREYDAYKVFVPKSKIEVFLQDEFWPEGVVYRRFVDFKRRYRSVQAPSKIPDQK